jgi:hypothetical protein
MESIEDFKKAYVRPHNYTEGGTSPIHKWIVPSIGQVKINWDATMDKGGGKMGFGVMVRDREGEILTTLLAPRLHIANPTVAEAIGH